MWFCCEKVFYTRNLQTAAELGVIQSKDMSKYKIEKNSGGFHIVKSYAGSPLVCNGKSSNGGIKLPCRNQNHAKEVMDKIRDVLKEGGGEIWL
jgi:hypothetical protein